MEKMYLLKHKDEVAALVAIDEDDGRLVDYKAIDQSLVPFLGNADLRLMKYWWESRAVPAARKEMQEIIRQSGCINSEMYLAKNLALSISDTYWLCPVDVDLKWNDVNLFVNKTFDNSLIPYHNQTSYDVNASLGGQMDKYWDMNGEVPELVKKAYRANGQQGINEVFATLLHEKQGTSVPFTKYSARRLQSGGVEVRCQAFTSQSIEFVSAFEIINSRPKNNSMSDYEAFIDICVASGLDPDCIRSFLDYQTLTDFVLTNTDEHYMNFGVLRDVNTLKFVAPAPIFDSGNSMFFDVENITNETRIQILDRKIVSLCDREEDMLKKVVRKTIVNADKLPLPDEIVQLYSSYGIDEHRACCIASNYSQKVEMLEEFQRGRTISLYHEKQKKRQDLSL